MTVLDEPQQGQGIVDFSRGTLSELISHRTDALDAAISRVTAGAENEPLKSVSAFNSAV